MKYMQNNVVDAIYDHKEQQNPFLSAMPELLPKGKFMELIEGKPSLPASLPYMSSEERRQALSLLSSIFVPMQYMYTIYDQLYRAITTTYTTRTVIEGIRQSNALFVGRTPTSYATQASTGSILGVPGIGKTSAIQRCLYTLPQVISHTKFNGAPFLCNQILYLYVECPSDCSVKTLAYNILSALDRAIGSNYLRDLQAFHSTAVSAIATHVKILCMTHHVGLILVDEIQNAIMTARQNRQIKPLIKFLVELTNDTCTGVYFVGTPLAEELFISQDHLKRRTRGVRLLPLKPDGTYRTFLEYIWPYQFTMKPAKLTDGLANKLYDYSGGIPAYIIKIFQEAQVQALLHGPSAINDNTIQSAIDLLAIHIPKTYAGGTYISDFDIEEEYFTYELDKSSTAESPIVSRLYANKRGRKVTPRDPEDLLVAFKSDIDCIKHLKELGLADSFGR